MQNCDQRVECPSQINKQRVGKNAATHTSVFDFQLACGYNVEDKKAFIFLNWINSIFPLSVCGLLECDLL